MSKYIKFMFDYTAVPCWREDGVNMDWDCLREFNVDFHDIANLSSYATSFDLADGLDEEEWVLRLSENLYKQAKYFKIKNSDVQVMWYNEFNGRTEVISL